MKRMKVVGAAVLLMAASMASAQLLQKPGEVKEDQAADMIEQLFTLREPAKFKAAFEKAKKAGLAEQKLLEAQFLFAVDQQDDDLLIKLAPQFAAKLANFDLNESEIFSNTDDWESVVHFTAAVEALRANKPDVFKTQITEAFWKSPKHASIFGRYIEEQQMKAAMAKLVVKPEQKFANLSGGKQTTFKRLLGERQGLAIVTWSPWSQECQLSADNFKKLATHCLKEKVATVGLLTEKHPEVDEDANDFKKEVGAKLFDHWVRDTKGLKLTSLFRVRSVPSVILINANGKVLFHGSIHSPKFVKFLSEVDDQGDVEN